MLFSQFISIFVKIRKSLKKSKKMEYLRELLLRRGVLVPMDDNVFGIVNNKYVERYILEVDGQYYLHYYIHDNYVLHCYWEDIEIYPSLWSAEANYHRLEAQLVN